jgi:uncharacterized protein YxjI
MTNDDKQAQRVRDQVAAKAGVTGVSTGGGTIFTESVLVVNQKAKLIEVTNEYKVFDANGTQIGAVLQVGQSALKKVLRAVANVDMFMRHELKIVDAAGAPQLSLVKPRAFLRPKLEVADATGQVIGTIASQLRLGKARFTLSDAAGTQVGTLNAENFRAWNFSLADASGTEVAKITKTWEGLGKAMFTNADNYVVQILQPLSNPLHSIAIAAALGIDLILKQAKG